MKTGLDLNSIGVSQPGLERPSRAGSSSTTAVAPTSVPSDRVDLSEQAQRLSSAGTSVNSDFDLEKVERIKNAIRNGEFKVDAGAIADKLIRQASELLGASTAH
ncbi:MAG TPA: flagellar biosynthesis anti-sigma factor FlgM [Burkholderiaceae bacterium]|nr:flagellar biosynthesis anti-sigma factor FlgM [Burkholderiaceae bacterium]